MDRTDQTILDLLKKNSRISYKQIANIVKLSSPAVKTRITKLEEEGIIEGYGVRLNYNALGKPVTAFIHISVDKEDRDSFLEFVRNSSQVVECHNITGEYYAILKVRFGSTMELDQFLSEIQTFGETSTNIVLSTCKSGET